MPKRPPKLTKKAPQEQHIVPVVTETMQTIVTNKLVNPDLKTLFDVECNKELQVNVKDPDLTLFKSETPLIKPQDKVTIYRHHIQPQFEIDRALSELQSKVLRQRTINIETADLVTEYDKSVHFKDVYNYILCDKLPGNANTQKKIAGEAANYIVANQLLFKIEKVKQGKTYESIPLLVIPEKFEYNIFHMYHASLLSMHQGLWKTFLTIRNRYYIPNLFVKLCTFIQACHLCQRHIPPQFEIDRALSELRSKVLRQRTINIETADLITEYDKSVCFKDIYNYILRDKLPGSAITQKKIAGEAANYIVANQLLFKIEKVKQGKTYESIPLLVIPEKFEYNIFHMYHASLLSMHQGLWKTFLTIRNRYYIPNLFVKLCTFIQACHLCQRSKPRQKQGTPHYGYVPKDYTPLEHLAVDIKYMPDGFDGFCFLIVVTCEQTNFVFAHPIQR